MILDSRPSTNAVETGRVGSRCSKQYGPLPPGLSGTPTSSVPLIGSSTSKRWNCLLADTPSCVARTPDKETGYASDSTKTAIKDTLPDTGRRSSHFSPPARPGDHRSVTSSTASSQGTPPRLCWSFSLTRMGVLLGDNGAPPSWRNGWTTTSLRSRRPMEVHPYPKLAGCVPRTILVAN